MLTNGVVSVKREEIFLNSAKDISGNMPDDGENNSAEDPTMKLEASKAEKRKLKAATTTQLNELGVSGGVEPRSLEEIGGIKASLERLVTIKEKSFEIMEELWTLYQQQKDTERQVKVGDEADELNERIEGKASAARPQLHGVFIR